MNVETLKYFLAAAEAGSISAASRELYMSQWGLNKALKSLEQELGHTLVKRTRSGIALTEAGRMVEDYARQVGALTDELTAALDATGDANEVLESGCAKIAATPICIYSVLQPMVKRGMLRNAIIREFDATAALDLARKSGWIAMVDLLPQVYDTDEICSEFSCERLLTTRVGLVYRKKHFCDIPRTVAPENAAGLPLGLHNCSMLGEIIREIFGSDLPEGTVITSSDENFIIDAMLEGSCVLLGDEYYWQAVLKALGTPEDRVVFSQLGDYPSDFVIARKRRSSSEVEAFVRGIVHMQERMAAEIGWKE